MARLQVIVDKTAGDQEREAMALLAEHPHDLTQSGGSTGTTHVGSWSGAIDSPQ